MTQTDMPELLHCHCCGKKAKYFHTRRSTGGGAPYYNLYSVGCSGHLSTPYFETKNEAAQVWNTRADLAPAPKADTPTPPNAALDDLIKHTCGVDESLTVYMPRDERDKRNAVIEDTIQLLARMDMICALRNTENKG